MKEIISGLVFVIGMLFIIDARTENTRNIGHQKIILSKKNALLTSILLKDSGAYPGGVTLHGDTLLIFWKKEK
jgi:hypothetical protein